MALKLQTKPHQVKSCERKGNVMRILSLSLFLVLIGSIGFAKTCKIDLVHVRDGVQMGDITMTNSKSPVKNTDKCSKMAMDQAKEACSIYNMQISQGTDACQNSPESRVGNWYQISWVLFDEKGSYGSDYVCCPTRM